MALTQKDDSAAKPPGSIIGFVWRPEEITPAVIQMAQRTGSRAIFDFSMMGVGALRSFLRKADTAGHVRDIKISVQTFLDPCLGQLLKETGAQAIWVECHPQFFQGDPAIFIRRLRDLSADHRCFPVTGDLDLLAAILKNSAGIASVVLKGCEASGFVSSETVTALYAMVKELQPTPAKSLDVLIWGGIATPEAAAAFLSTGARGIVFESVHWLTDQVASDDLQRQRLARLRLDSTDLVGLDLLVPCRLFNKGNSRAFREIKAFEDSLYGAEIKEESRRSFTSQILARALHPLESHFSQDEVVPLGVEAAFAAAFVERFGFGTEAAVTAFMDEIRNLCHLAGAKKTCFLDSPVAREMGTLYPFIQGAMSWITDVPEFASRIADAGGLPTFALGLMDAKALDRRLGRLPQIMGERAYAVNIISLAENPFRETHLAWIKKQRPRFVVIAGGDLSPLRQLIECGIEVIYIAPDEALLKLALEAGVRYVICEGYEAGGHVGQHSTLTLAQMVLEQKRRTPSLFQNCRLILAGGIYNRETAFMAAMLGAEAIQMGTAYLATREIVETGALTALYQRMVLESPPGGTVVSGKDTGLRVRSLRTPRIEAILSLEKKFAAGHQDEVSFRTGMEEMAAGSLFAAARGKERTSEAPLDEQTCLERGQFMSGACAGLICEVRKLRSFHRELAEGHLVLQQPVVGEFKEAIEPLPAAPLPREFPSAGVGYGRKSAASPQAIHERIAITGMSILNALGKSPEEVWGASLAMKSGITTVPPSRWDHGRYYDPRPRVSDRTYCNVGAFLDFQISRNELGIPPQDFRSMTSATQITMWLANQAIRDAGLLASDIPRERISAIIAQNSGEAAGTLNSIIIRAYVHDILAAVNRAVPLSPEQASAIEREVKTGRMAPDDTTLLGRLNCAAPGFICNRYGFMGPSYAVSAACSTSLVALHSAIQLIRNGIIDAAVVGGGEEHLTHLHFLEFSALGALYGLSGRERPAREASRPFDAHRDGLVLGEGGGMIIVERESLARARGAHIHAIITGMGASNSHLGMVESVSSTQELAIRSSFQGLPYGPEAVALVECHATSTRQGDVEEVRALKTFFNSDKRTVLTSFKSQIGHTLGAAGLNNLIRGTMAMQTGVFPATLNYEHPDPEMGLKGSGLLIAPEPLDWQHPDHRPRRLQVNAFGFGGSNYVVQMEQALDDAATILVCPNRAAGLTPAMGGSPPAIPGVSCFRTEMDGHSWRLAVVARSDHAARELIESTPVLAEAGSLSSRALRSLAQQGIFLRREELPTVPLALVFPGQGAQYRGMGRELYEAIPVIREWMDRAAAAADFDLLQLLFHDREENLQKTRWQQPAMFAMEHALARYLLTLGVHPVAMAGHSLGELTALCLAGVFSPEDGFRIVNQRAICMDKAAAMHGEPGVMAAVDAPLQLLQELIRDREHVHIGNINSPQQIVLSGHTEPVKNFCKVLKERGYRATLLPVSMAFHSPIMEIIHDELETFVAAIPFHPPQLPVLSNTTMAPYPAEPDEIRRILMAHLEAPVHWMENVQTLWNDHGVRLFVEVGPGDILSSLIADTLSEPSCIQTCLPGAEELTCKSALARLFVEGQLPGPAEPMLVALPAFPKASAAERSTPQEPAIAVLAETAETQEQIEALIRIIMDATGFTREEIQPEMDLRKDLSIRSSRLPIIMDAAERHFGITIELEDFIQVRTVRDIARKIAEIVVRKADGGLSPDGSAAPAEAPIPSEPLSPALAATAETPEQIEALIQIIMDATGFTREEIQPEMDLRRDLSIRSSRLPIIMDAAERHFGITIELEDFIQVRTVRDIAGKIAEIVAGQAAASLPPATTAAEPGSPQAESVQLLQTEADLKRLVFKSVPVALASPSPIQPGRGEAVLVLSPHRDDELAGRLADIVRQDYGVESLSRLSLQEQAAGPAGCDLVPGEGARQAAASITKLSSPAAGMIVALPKGWARTLTGMEDVPRLLSGLLLPLQAVLQSPAKKFVVLIHYREDAETPGRLLAEGLLGLFLSAAQEYPSVQFRTVEIETATDLRTALRGALDRGCPVVELMHRDGTVLTSQGQVAPSIIADSSTQVLNPGDVVVMSGGATGISAHLARSLAPFMPRLVMLGRTLPAPDSDLAKVLPGQLPVEAAAADHRTAEIARTLADLHAAGIEATYYPCDVTDPEAVRTLLGEVVRRYGRVDGIIHGAGVLRDGFLSHLTPDDFSRVTDVKFRGAWNLFSAAQGAGLKFFVGLSSAAAIQGNPGQANYAAANRMMSAFIESLRRQNGAIRCKALMLPPIEGAGMAEDPELRELLQSKGVAYIDANELAGLFCRELLVAPADDIRVMFMRSLPALKTTLLNAATPVPLTGELAGGTVSLRPGDFPLIERVTGLDLRREELEAGRTFSLTTDLWIADHRPFTFIKHPLVSAAMILETFMEAARILYPHLQVRRVRQVRLMEMIQCPPGVSRPTSISCRRAGSSLREVVCDVALAAREISPAGRLMDRFTPHCLGQVILAGGEGPLGAEFTDFPVRPDELQTKPMDHRQVLAWYRDRSGLAGRYRVMESLDGAGAGVVRGRTIYQETSDFANLSNVRYQYSPYLFEALLQLVGFHLAATDPTERRSLIPLEIGEMSFARPCRAGESLTLEARLRTQDNDGRTWDARGIDDQGGILMQVQGMRMHWVSA